MARELSDCLPVRLYTGITTLLTHLPSLVGLFELHYFTYCLPPTMQWSVAPRAPPASLPRPALCTGPCVQQHTLRSVGRLGLHLGGVTLGARAIIRQFHSLTFFTRGTTVRSSPPLRLWPSTYTAAGRSDGPLVGFVVAVAQMYSQMYYVLSYPVYHRHAFLFDPLHVFFFYCCIFLLPCDALPARHLHVIRRWNVVPRRALRSPLSRRCHPSHLSRRCHLRAFRLGGFSGTFWPPWTRTPSRGPQRGPSHYAPRPRVP